MVSVELIHTIGCPREPVNDINIGGECGWATYIRNARGEIQPWLQ